MNDQKCPKCQSANGYPDGDLWVCPDCYHEWNPDQSPVLNNEELQNTKISDSNGNQLSDGDSVIVVKDLKVKGASTAIKGGTKVRNIRLVESSNGHNISCKVDGFGAMYLKSEFVRKA